MKKFIELATHILAMNTDSYLSGHPEWNELVNEAKNALKADKRSYNIAILKDLKNDYDMGIISTDEYNEKVNAINIYR